MWTQELLWVKRNEHGVIIAVQELPPDKEDFIPYLPDSSQYPYNKNSHRPG